MWRRILYFFCVPCRPNKSRTVRYAFSLVFATAITASLATVAISDSTYLILRSDTSTVRAGEEFSVELYAVAGDPVNAVDITLDFPSAQVEVLGIDTGLSVITLWTEDPVAKNNQITFSGGTFRQGFIGEHLIASISMKAVESGTANIEVSEAQFLAGDGSGSEIDIDNVNSESARIYIANKDGTLVAELNVEIITDLNGDGEVTLSDIDTFMSAWRNKNVIFDFNVDNNMNFSDFAIILADPFIR